MKLIELIELGILSENAAIAQSIKQKHRCNAGKTCDGCSCVHNKPLVNVIRNYGTIIKETLIKAGGEKYLDCEVTNIFAYRSNKLGIEIKI